MTVNFPTRPGMQLAAAVVFLVGYVTSASAQSLGDVARREAERRQQVTSGKVYTNGDLAPVDPASTPPPQAPVEPSAPSGGESAAPSSAPTPAPGNNPDKESTVVNGREQRDEHYWRTLIRGLRGRVDRANVEVAAQEARLMEIDGGPQTPATQRDREIVAATLSRAQRDARSLNEELKRTLTRAQNAKVPDEWIR